VASADNGSQACITARDMRSFPRSGAVRLDVLRERLPTRDGLRAGPNGA
jgi:hypothetical protein